jgi:hypothetical protein
LGGEAHSLGGHAEIGVISADELKEGTLVLFAWNDEGFVVVATDADGAGGIEPKATLLLVCPMTRNASRLEDGEDIAGKINEAVGGASLQSEEEQ